MATVEVLSAERTLELVGGSVVGGLIDEDGDLILIKQDESVVNLGNIKVDNYRAQYNAEIDFDGADPEGVVETVTITDDETDTATWLNRLVYRFKEGVEAVARRTTYLNEYGELRVAPAKHNTVGARFFVKELPDNPDTARSTTVPVVELMDNRTDRNSLRGWLGDGTETRNGISMSDVLVLGPLDSVPVGTPVGTVILRTEE